MEELAGFGLDMATEDLPGLWAATLRTLPRLRHVNLCCFSL
jgi:hypothetical protein